MFRQVYYNNPDQGPWLPSLQERCGMSSENGGVAWQHVLLN